MKSIKYTFLIKSVTENINKSGIVNNLKIYQENRNKISTKNKTKPNQNQRKKKSQVTLNIFSSIF